MEFSKTDRQIEATKLMASSSLHVMCYGGSRSGKTFNIVRALIVRASKVKSRHAVFRKTFNSVKTSIWLDTLPKVLSICFPHLVVNYNKTDFYITLPNGSEIWFCGLDDDKRVEKVLGKEFSTLFFNECSEISYYSTQIVLSRLAEKTLLNKKVYYDMNPPSKAHWSYWLFIRHVDPVDNEPIDNKQDYAHIKMNPKDNIDNIDPMYLDILAKMPEKERQRFLDGEFADSDDGQAYYAFDRDLHVNDSIGKKMGTIVVGMDFNVHPMTAVIGQVINGEIHVFDEIYQENSNTPKIVNELIKRGYRGAMVIPDSTGANRKTSGKSDFKILKDNGFRIPPVFNPLQVDRVNNVNRLLTEEKLKIHKRCKKLINDMERVAWKDNKLDQKGENKMLTHISDALGYFCWKIAPMQDLGSPITMNKYR